MMNLNMQLNNLEGRIIIRSLRKIDYQASVTTLHEVYLVYYKTDYKMA